MEDIAITVLMVLICLVQTIVGLKNMKKLCIGNIVLL